MFLCFNFSFLTLNLSRVDYVFKFKKNGFDFSSFVLSNSFKTFSDADIKFFEWFIGFSEGDGNFGIMISPSHRDRCCFCINQADKEILDYIQGKLGLGKVSTFTQKTKLPDGTFEDRVYARFVVSAKAEIECLIHLFNGNLHINKCYQKFSKWVQTYNHLYAKEIHIKPKGPVSRVSLDNSWLIGFWEADGGFSAYFNSNKKGKKAIKPQIEVLQLKAYLDQKGEKDLLVRIKILLKGSFTTRNKEKEHYRVEITSFAGLNEVKMYFANTLISKKRLVYRIWLELVELYLDKTHPDNKNLLVQRELVNNLQAQNALFKKVKSVLLLPENFSEI